MRVTLLGTGGSAGVPMIGGPDGAGDWGACDPAEARNRRTRASIIIENPHNQRLLVDSSPDMRDQFLSNRIPGADAILFTHAHADHITGIDDVRILNRIVKRPLEAFATRQTLDELTRRFGYAFAPWDGKGFYRPVLVAKNVSPGETIRPAGLDVRVFNQGHGRITTLGLRVGPFAYSTDVIELDDAALEALAGVDTWVVGCFLRSEHHWTHANLPVVFDWVRRLRPRRTILTHMGPDMDWAWLQANLPPGIEAGHDGMVLDFPES
jgi:phosphoribosyl 1,2-cyclic phosphate phosphodiesterase